MHQQTYYNKKRIWITGASQGIGKALAIALSQYDVQLIISARNQAALDEIAKQSPGNVLVLPFDVQDKAANLSAIATIKATLGGLDIAIFNAGTAEYVDVKQFDSDLFSRVLNTNFMSMVYGIEAALPLLRESKQPHIVGMSSTAAYGGLPRSEAYGASKAAIRNMLEALRISLSPENIAVSIICPGFVKTPLTDKNDFPMPMMIEADEAANIIIKEIAQGREEIYFPKRFSFILKFLTSLPSPLYTKLIRKLVLRK